MLVLISNEQINCFTAFFGKQRSGGLDVSLALRYFGDRTNLVIEPAYKYNTWTAQMQYRWRTNTDFHKKVQRHIVNVYPAFWTQDREQIRTGIGWYGKIFISPILPLLEPGYRCNTNTEQIQHTNRTNTLQKKNKYCDRLVWGDFH